MARTDQMTTYRATDLRTNQEVALKVPHADIASDQSVFERFQREKEIGTKLDHPGVVKVLDDPDHSRPYIVTEWFEGKSLRAILDEKKKLSTERAVRITVGICNVLEYIHGHGIVHRNLKPENILVDSSDHIKLINFDVAAVTGASRITFTNLSQLVGASPYISPEELTGKRGDARSDIYSLGVILYEMLTGANPFVGEDPFDRLQLTPIPARNLNPAISLQLQEVIYRALEREHRKRYASAQDFAHDLQHLDEVAVRQRSASGAPKQNNPAASRKIILTAAILLVPVALFLLLLLFARH